MKSQVEADLQALKDAVAATTPENITPDQVADLKAKKETLMQSANQLFTKMYEQQAQANGGAQADSGAGANTGAGSADDVVDGDYKEV